MLPSVRHSARGLIGFCALVTVVLMAHPARAADDRGFATQLHADDQTFVVIEDPLPHLKTLLASQAMRRAVAKGPLAELFKADDGVGADPLQWWAWLNDHQRWIPRQVALGISDGGVTDVDHFFRAIALVELINAAHAGDDGRNQRIAGELKTLRRSMLTEIKQLRLPRMRLYVRFRTVEDAVSLLDMLRQQIKDIDPKDLPGGLRLEQAEDVVSAKFSLADQFENDEGMAAFLHEMHLTEADDVNFSRDIIAAAQKISAEATIRRVGDALVLTLGPADAGGAAGLAARFTTLPADVGNADADTIIWARWDTRRLKEAAVGWMTLHEQWARSATFALLTTNNHSDETMLDVARSVAVEIARLGDSGAARIWVDRADSALKMTMREERVRPAQELSKSPLAAWIPADAEAYSADMTLGLGEYLSNMLSQMEGRMSLQSLKAMLQPEDANAARADQIAAGFYTHFSTLRELVHKTGRDRFERGMVGVLGTKGKVDRLEASFILEGHATRMSLRNLPTIEIALLARPRAPADEAAMKKYMEDLYSALTTGIHSAARPPQEEGKPLLAIRTEAKSIELGLGVPTWGFDAAGLQQATGEAKLNIAVDGDLRPHFFFVDSTLVFSTSPRLSKALLEAHSGKAERMKLPQEPADALVASGRLSGDAMARTAEHTGAWFAEFMNHLDRAGRARPDAGDSFAKVFSSMAQIMRLVDRIEWRTSQSPGPRPSHTSRGGIYFAEEK